MREALTYARAALPLIPGASRLPFVAGRGRELPALERTSAAVRIDPDELADYARVCGFATRDTLPATYLHVRAFPLHMALMTDGRFPFPAVGLVHLANRIVVHRPARVDETFELRVRTTPLAPHPKGRTFRLVSEARVGDELVWEDHSTMLRRGAGGDAARAAEAPSPPPAKASATWRLAADLGRRYGAVSGDRNPIHLHPLTAKAFGFPRAIAHGMWTKAACLATLEDRLPDAYAVEVAFRKPILLPGAVAFAEQDGRFAVRAAADPDLVHLEGTVTP
jgi:hypothetical protein